MPAGTQAAAPPAEGQAAAVFAGGCFWCMEKPFDLLPGVISTTSGYTGGAPDHPTYTQVSNKLTTHVEAIRVVYDPSVVSYEELLSVFWHNIDPTQDSGQFCDKGPQYRSALFPATEAERALAQASKGAVASKLEADIVTEIRPAATFWEAEEYHQDFYVKEPAHYQSYRTGCGRDRRLKELWGPKPVTEPGPVPGPVPPAPQPLALARARAKASASSVVCRARGGSGGAAQAAGRGASGRRWPGSLRTKAGPRVGSGLAGGGAQANKAAAGDPAGPVGGMKLGDVGLEQGHRLFGPSAFDQGAGQRVHRGRGARSRGSG